MTREEFETLRDAAAEKYSEAFESFGVARASFNNGADFAYDLMQKRVDELEAKLAICKNALERIANGGADNGVFMNAINRHLLQCEIAIEALAQLEGKAE